jgi:hypothetical protein
MTLLRRQFDTGQAFFVEDGALNSQDIEGEIKQAAENAGETLTDEELKLRVDERLAEGIALANTLAKIYGIAPIGRLSSDGARLIFLRVEVVDFELLLSSQPDIDGVLFFLYLVDLTSGAEPQVLSSETQWRPGFAFSPDSQEILFESNREGGRSLYLANANGANIRRIVEDTQGACWH